MTKTGVQEYVKKVMEAPSCCPEAKAACEAYLTAAGSTEAAKKAKAAGEKYCMCPACQAGGKVLDNADAILV